MNANPAPRLALLFLCLIASIAWPARLVAQLVYLDASPGGPEFPSWDGGDTELEFGDIDSDGNVDFLSIGDHGSPFINTNEHGIMVYFSDGAGGWSLHQEGNFGYGGIAVADLNLDGILDVAYGMHHNYAGSDFGDQLMEAALGDGTGTSWSPWDDGLAGNGEDYGMFATDCADFDADGWMDVVAGSFGCCNGLHVYRNNGDGSWTQTWARVGGNSQHRLCTGDVDGDGYPDIAASYQYGCVWINDGQGGFIESDTGLPALGSTGMPGVALGDVDGDGRADLACCPGGGVQVYLWRDDHWEASAGLPASGSYDIAQLWDMDADGLMDVMALGAGTAALWRGDGLGGWTPYGGFSAAPATDTAAFRAGGDFDHNGRPDLVFVQEEGSWPNYQNHLYAYRESSSPAARTVVLQSPRGSERYLAGSAQTIRWCAAHLGDDPAFVDLELSVTGPEGPWSSIATGIPDGGHRQWIVPGPPADQAYLRVTLRQSGESVSALSGAFTILPGLATAAAEGGPPVSPALRLLANPVSDSARFEILAGAERGAKQRFLAIYTASGRRVRRLAVSGTQVNWDLCDADGKAVASGVYLARLGLEAAGSGEVALRVVVLR